MEASQDTFGLRIILVALLIGVFIVGLVTYQTYSDDLKQGMAEKMVELMPDMENSLAAL